jgi:folylpolyglutamate synthase/dihydropteroate synthase
MMADKDTGSCVAHLSAFAAQVIVTLPPESGRLRRNAGELADSFEKAGIPAVVREDWRTALEDACGSGMAVVVAGSLYLAGAARTWWLSTHSSFTSDPRCSPAVLHPECDFRH